MITLVQKVWPQEKKGFISETRLSLPLSRCWPSLLSTAVSYYYFISIVAIIVVVDIIIVVVIAIINIVVVNYHHHHHHYNYYELYCTTVQGGS